MLSDSEVIVSGFPSNWNISRTNEDCSAQTLEICKDAHTIQTVNLHTVGVQTGDNEARNAEAKYDEAKLAEFLVRICPAVVTELGRISRSNAFTSYSLIGEETDEVLEVLKVPSSSEGVKVADMSWSCTGSVLAVAYSYFLHTGWCNHQGHLKLYNIDREGRGPSSTLNTTTCIRSVSMHPYISSIVAAGTISGEVVVWDTSRETTLAKMTAASHNDSVSQVRWALGTGASATLVSAALDGHLILWKVSPHLSMYQLLDRFTFDMSSPKAGVTAFAFPHHQLDVFVVCLEGGTMHHCSAAAAKPLAFVGSLESLKDPVISTFEQQPVTVTCIEFSPHLEDVFATVATDQAIRIYSLSQRCSQQIIWAGAMVGLGWNPVQAHVLAAWGDSSQVKLYNSNTGDTLISLAPDCYKDYAHISSVKYNSKSNRLIAVGDLVGNVSVWDVPAQVSTIDKE